MDMLPYKDYRAPDKRGYRGEFKDNFSYFSMKMYVVTRH